MASSCSAGPKAENEASSLFKLCTQMDTGEDERQHGVWVISACVCVSGAQHLLHLAFLIFVYVSSFFWQTFACAAKRRSKRNKTTAGDIAWICGLAMAMVMFDKLPSAFLTLSFLALFPGFSKYLRYFVSLFPKLKGTHKARKNGEEERKNRDC